MLRIIICIMVFSLLYFFNKPESKNDISNRSIPQQTVTTPTKDKLADAISSRYRIDSQFAKQVVEFAHMYGNASFPTPKDILAIISIESSFNPTAKSKLKKDPAVGLTQIRPNVWKRLIKPGELTSTENQVKYAAMILTQYHAKLGDVTSAVNAYNVGLTAHLRGTTNHKYIRKFYTAHEYL